MTAPPDRILAYVAHDGRLMGITDAKANPNIDWPAYILRDGPTMQAAIAAAEARGREQGLREAAGKVLDWGDLDAEQNEPHIAADILEDASDLANAVLALIPAPKEPRRASGPIDPENGFATTGAEARWIANTDAGVYDVEPTDEELGIAPNEYQITTVDDFRRLTMEQRQRIMPDLLHWAACVNDMERTGIFKSSGAFIWVDDDRPGEVSEVRFDVPAPPPADGGEG